MRKLAIAVLLIILVISCKNIQEKDENVFFVFEPDIGLFTSYAFMNAAGYNHNWNPAMHHIRIDVREYLDSILTDDYKQQIHMYNEKAGGGDF